MRKLFLCALVALVSSAAFAAAGSPDPTFGSGGLVSTNFGVDVRPSGAAVQANGDIVVAVTVGDNPTSAALVRYLPNGNLDPSFGTGGIVTEMFQDQVNGTGGVAIQPDGKIVVFVVSSNTTGSVLEALLVRFNSNGTLDSSFGSGGQLALSYPAASPYSASPIAAVLEPSGDFLVLFSLTPPFRNHSPVLTALARYTPNGALDATFGTNGDGPAVSLGASAISLGLLSNGNAIAVLSTGQSAEFSSTGSLLASVSAGTVVANAFFFDYLGNPVFQPNSDYVALSAAQGSGPRLDIDSKVIRFLANGTADTTFQSPLFDFAPVGADVGSIAEALALAPNGQIVVSGEAVTAQNSSVGFGVARLNSNGSIDTTFGNNGIAITTLPNGGQALVVLVQPDGKVLAVGQVFPVGDIQLGVARYLAQ